MAVVQQPIFSARHPEGAQPPEDASVEVVVLHTTTKATLRSLRTAAELAAGLAARIRLLVLEVVPYELELDAPRVPLEFTQRRFCTVVSQARIDTWIDLRVGRDRRWLIESALKPGSLVVMERRCWWSFEHRLAKRLERAGHHVVFAD